VKFSARQTLGELPGLGVRRLGWFVLAGLCLLASSCGDGGSSEPSAGASSPSTSGGTVLHVVALGDSETTGSGDPTAGGGWVQYYARLLETKLGYTVEVKNLAQEGLTSDQLLAALNAEPTSSAVKEAEIVLLGIGGADLNEGDDNLEAGACKAEACYEPVLKDFARNLGQIVTRIGVLRAGQKTVLREITQPNGFPGAEDVIPPFLKPVAAKIGIYQARTANQAICETMTKHGGRCIDVLLAFNGPSGMENAYQKGLMNHEDCCYPSAKGQQLMADLLFQTGLAPLR
jgi:lysophospholipase L1-like esterase